METQPVDLRSDTVTRPTAGMRRAMADAEVGDDVYGEDPTVRALEERTAELLGTEAAVFVPSGTMGNQIAIHLLADRGADVLLEAGCHVYVYELGAMAAWTGALPRVLQGERGLLDPGDVRRAVAPPVEYLARTRLLLLENTHNTAGGIVLRPERHAALVEAARDHELRVHLDGARLLNAAVALGRPPAELTAGVDTVMVCLSKGLGAPVGSVLCGTAALMREARIVRKRMGGGMRQVGVLAAAGLYALEHHVERLAEDHARAARLARALAELGPFRIDPATVETNIVVTAVDPVEDAPTILRALAERGVLAGGMGPGRIRFVTHLDVDDVGLDRAIDALREVAAGVA